MKAVIFQEKGKVIIKDIPKPKVKSDEVLIKIKYCGICGSDIESYESGALIPTGLVIGHEFSGEIMEIGEAVKKWKIGDRVTANPNIPCFKCYWCLKDQENMCKKSPHGIGLTVNGAMAEFIKVKDERLHDLGTLSFEEGALIEPLAIVTFAVQQSGFKVGENAVVIGAGSIGLLLIQVLKAAGASDIFVIEPAELQQKKAMELGVTEVFNPDKWSKINKLTRKIGPDHIFDCVGVPRSFNDSLKIVRKGGHITIIGLHAEPFTMEAIMQLPMKNITIRGVFSYTQGTFRDAINLIKYHKLPVTSIITKKIPIDQAPEAFKTLSTPGNSQVKILVEF
ncbi:MAG: zinc-dependent alcohol dehydrogenase [Candidatus Helarchaeota archaeon]